MLRIDVIGNLGGEPELVRTRTDRELVQFSVAINARRQNADGEWEDKPTEWFRVRAMGAQLERARSLGKGERVFVAGRLDINRYTSRDGEPRTGFDVWADEVASLAPRAPSGDGRQAPATAKSGAGRGIDEAYEPDTDLPF